MADKHSTSGSGSLTAAWDEGYWACLWDFGIQRTTEEAIKASQNPHGTRWGRRNLTECEKFEIRNALGYHFGKFGCDDPEALEETASILEVTILRMLARRPERGA